MKKLSVILVALLCGCGEHVEPTRVPDAVYEQCMKQLDDINRQIPDAMKKSYIRGYIDGFTNGWFVGNSNVVPQTGQIHEWAEGSHSNLMFVATNRP